MKKILNSADAFVDEVLEGILAAHPDQLRAVGDGRAVVRVDAGAPGRVGIVTGGGSGHLPLFLGYVGVGLASGVAVGNVFSSPSSEQILAATLASDGGAGVLYLYGNYGGDVYNFDLAGEMAAVRGVRTTTVLGADDVLSAPAENRTARRGVAGIALVFKCAGAAAERGDGLDEVTRIAQKAADNVVTMGVGLSPTILPAAGRPTFELADGEMEIGVGIHGEPGRRRGPIETADQIADEFCQALVGDLGLVSGERVAVLVNGLGATPVEELYLLYRRVHAVLGERGVTIEQRFIGEYATSLEMAGASVSIMRLDDELAELLAAPAESPFVRFGRGAEVGERTDRPGSDRDAEPTGREMRLGGSGVWRSAILRWAEALPAYAEELRELDAAVGDGDLGITVTAGCRAIAGRLGEMPSDAADGEVLVAAGEAFSGGNPSTFAALVGSGLMRAGMGMLDGSVGDVAGVVGVVRRSIQDKGHAERGDKTIVDPLMVLEESLAARPSDWDAAVEAVRAEVDRGADKVNRRGRAAWLQERSAGHADPGSVALLRLLEVAVG